MLSSLDLAKALLGYLRNIDDYTDAKEFVRIYLDSYEAAGEAINRDEILKLISQTDFRFKEAVVIERVTISYDKFTKSGTVYIGRQLCEKVLQNKYQAELIIRKG
jgi:hypothetical protein